MSNATDAEFTETSALAVPEPLAPPATLFHTEDPVEVIDKATRVANALNAVIEQKKLYTIIQGKKYVQIEGWQTVGAMLNLTTICESTTRIENGWEASVVVRNIRGEIIGRAENQCTTLERRKKVWDDYAIRSMAQTRATSKALRSILAWVMVLAGYQATPMEEMPQDAPAAPKEGRVLNSGQVYAKALQHGFCADGDSFRVWIRENVPSCADIKPSEKQLTPDQCRDIVAAMEATK